MNRTSLASFLAVLLLAGCGGQGQRSDAEPAAPPSYHVESDHDVYPSRAALDDRADAVVIGTVTGSEVVAGISPGNDDAGDPIPAVPHTQYAVTVDETIKGAPKEGSSVTVSIPGGVRPEGAVAVEGTPALAVGTQALYYLKSGSGGLFYPLAAGSAVGIKTPNGSFALPAEATGTGVLELTAAQAKGTDPAPRPQPSPQGGAPVGGTGAPSAATGPLLKTSLIAKQRLATVLRRGLRLRVTCSEACSLAVRAELPRATARKLGIKTNAKSVIVASGHAAKAGTLVVKFSSSTAKALRRRQKITLSLIVRATGPAGGVTTLTRKLTLTTRSARIT
jgi:hypothetical protein